MLRVIIRPLRQLRMRYTLYLNSKSFALLKLHVRSMHQSEGPKHVHTIHIQCRGDIIVFMQKNIFCHGKPASIINVHQFLLFVAISGLFL